MRILLDCNFFPDLISILPHKDIGIAFDADEIAKFSHFTDSILKFH